jgi:hypothetical protein
VYFWIEALRFGMLVHPRLHGRNGNGSACHARGDHKAASLVWVSGKRRAPRERAHRREMGQGSVLAQPM